MLRSLGLALIAIGLVACSSVTYTNERLDAAQRELNRRYGLWKDTGILSYDYRFERTCPCDSSLMRPVLVSVVDSAIASVVYADDGTAVPDSARHSYFTVVGLFQQAQIAINLLADSLVLEYDPLLNYPTKIVVDQNRFTAEDELGLFASELKPKQP